MQFVAFNAGIIGVLGIIRITGIGGIGGITVISELAELQVAVSPFVVCSCIHAALRGVPQPSLHIVESTKRICIEEVPG